MSTEKLNNDKKRLWVIDKEVVNYAAAEYLRILLEMRKKINPPSSIKLEHRGYFNDIRWMRTIIHAAILNTEKERIIERARLKLLKLYFCLSRRSLAQMCLMDDIITILSEEQDILYYHQKCTEGFREARDDGYTFRSNWERFCKTEHENPGALRQAKGDQYISSMYDKVLCMHDVTWRLIKIAQAVQTAQETYSKERYRLLFYAYGPKLNNEVLELFTPEKIAEQSELKATLKNVIALRSVVTQRIDRWDDREISTTLEAGCDFRKRILIDYYCIGWRDAFEVERQYNLSKRDFSERLEKMSSQQ